MRFDPVNVKSTILLTILCSFVHEVIADTLTTPSFTVTVESHCEEGEVTCNDVTYLGVSKKTGKPLALKGKTIHSKCKDSIITPCRFVGYKFKSGTSIYQVLADGTLEVTQNGKVLVHEQGEWR